MILAVSLAQLLMSIKHGHLNSMQARTHIDPPTTFNITPLRVMLVEDEVLFARAVARRLQKAGY